MNLNLYKTPTLSHRWERGKLKIIILAILITILLESSLTLFAASSDNTLASSDSLNNESEKSWSIDPYFTQSVYLKWIEEGNIGDFQGLLVPELGTIIKGNTKSDISLYLDISVTAEIFDIYNIRFAPVDFNVNKANLTRKTDYSSKYLPDILKLELYPNGEQYNDIYNLGLEAKWCKEKDLEIYIEFLVYDLFSEASYNFSNNKSGLTIGAQWFDIFDKGVEKSTDFKIGYEGLKNKINLQLKQQINDSLSLEVAYNHNYNISTSISYNINKNWQLELISLYRNTHIDNNKPSNNAREFSLITSISYIF